MSILDDIRKKYSAKIFCYNCGFRGMISIPKGTTIDEHLKSIEGKCSNCGCNTLFPSTDSITENPLIKSIINKADLNKREYQHGSKEHSKK